MDERIGRLTSLWATIDGLTVHARVAANPSPGERLPVVLVQGLVVSSRYMVPTAVRLASDRRVYAPDLPGFRLALRRLYADELERLADREGPPDAPRYGAGRVMGFSSRR